MKEIVISSDSHVFEPDDLWTKALGKKWGDQLPRKVHGRPDDNSPYDFDFTGEEYVRRFGDTEREVKPGETEDYRAAGWDPALRVRCMDEDKVFAELLGPTTGLFLYSVSKYDMIRDCIGVYNDWLAEYASYSPKRLLRCAMVHMENVDWAIRELERSVNGGARSIMINGDTRPEWKPYRDRSYDPFWARASELGVPVQIHVLTGNKRHPLMLREHEFGNMARLHMDFANDIGLVIANEFIFGGIFDRFPKLKLIVGEYEVSWVPFWLFRLEQFNDSFTQAYNYPKAKRPIRDYLRQIYFGVVDDPNVQHVEGIVSPDRLLWGSDFPHTRNTFPNSHAVVKRVFNHLRGDDIDRVSGQNAASLLGVDLSKAN